jgi:hypothetical protein
MFLSTIEIGIFGELGLGWRKFLPSGLSIEKQLTSLRDRDKEAKDESLRRVPTSNQTDGSILPSLWGEPTK